MNVLRPHLHVTPMPIVSIPKGATLVRVSLVMKVMVCHVQVNITLPMNFKWIRQVSIPCSHFEVWFILGWGYIVWEEKTYVLKSRWSSICRETCVAVSSFIRALRCPKKYVKSKQMRLTLNNNQKEGINNELTGRQVELREPTPFQSAAYGLRSNSHTYTWSEARGLYGRQMRNFQTNQWAIEIIEFASRC